MDTIQQYWDNKFLKKNKIWGEKPSRAAESVVDKLGDSDGKKSLLDLACGYGRDTIFFREKGYPTVGLDLSEEAIKLAKNSQRDIVFKVGSIFETPFRNESFHIVFGNFILHLFSLDKRMKIIEESCRITRRGGIMIFSVSSINDPDYQKGEETEKNSFINARGVTKHYYSKKDIYNEFQNFSKVEIQSIEEYHTHDFPHTHQSYLIYAYK